MAKKILAAANNKEQKYFMEEEFKFLPDTIKEDLKRICVYMAEKLNCTFLVGFDDNGDVYFETIKHEGDFDFDEIFEGADWFHFTGITPALNDTVAAICLEACKKAKELGITVSCDLNYRNKLWTKAKAGEVMGELCKYVDVCIANEEDASDVFGIKASNTDVTKGAVNHEGYKDVAKQLADRFGFQKVAITLRESISANDNNWSAMLYDGKDYYFSKKYAMHIVDRVGGGDSFAGGTICGFVDGKNFKDALEFGVAASALKHTIPGDFNLVTREEVETLAGGDGSGRVQR